MPLPQVKADLVRLLLGRIGRQGDLLGGVLLHLVKLADHLQHLGGAASSLSLASKNHAGAWAAADLDDRPQAVERA